MGTESAEPTETETKDATETADVSAEAKPAPADANASVSADAKPEPSDASAEAKPEPGETKPEPLAAKVQALVDSKFPTPAQPTPRTAVGKPGPTKGARPATGKAVKTGSTGPKRPPARKSGFSLRNVILFGGLVALLLAAFGVLGNRDQGGPSNAPKWKLNEPVDVEITLVANDAGDLGCAMEGDVEGFHCGYSTQTAKHPSAGGPRDDGKLLQPYATTNKQNFLAAGVWLQAETKDALALDTKVKAMANPRFTLTCKFTPRGRAKAAKVQWKPGSDWGPGDGWYVGDVKDCKLAK